VCDTRKFYSSRGNYYSSIYCFRVMHQSIPAATIRPPPPQGQCGAFLHLLVPTAGHLQLRAHPGAGHLSISGYYPRAFVAHREKTAATSFLCRMPKWTTLQAKTNESFVASWQMKEGLDKIVDIR
jgi:hypothetical protein